MSAGGEQKDLVYALFGALQEMQSIVDAMGYDTPFEEDTPEISEAKRTGWKNKSAKLFALHDEWRKLIDDLTDLAI